MPSEKPQRKPTRLKDFDYSTSGAYFITICTEGRKNLLSRVVGGGQPLGCQAKRCLPPPEIQLKPCGEIAKEQLLLLEQRHPNISIDQYVIMPNHIHMILILRKDSGGASPSPTVSDIICAYKSVTSRLCKKKYFVEKIFQRSFYDHIIRDRDDYNTRVKYIHENPVRWYFDELYSAE